MGGSKSCENALERQPTSQLDQPWEAQRSGNLARRSAVEHQVRAVELRRVEGVQRLRTKFGTHPFRQVEILIKRQVRVGVARPIAVKLSRRIAVAARRSSCESRRIKVLVQPALGTARE